MKPAPTNRLIALGTSLLVINLAASAASLLPTNSGRHLMLSPSEAFQLRGFAYSPTPIGDYWPTNAYKDVRLIRRDGPIMAAALVNTIRIYGGLVISTEAEPQIGVTSEFFREAAANGLWAVVGTYIPSEMDFSDTNERARVVHAHTNFVHQFKNESNILMWAIGNELDGKVTNTVQLTNWYSLLNEVASAIKVEQGGGSGPGFGPYVTCVNGDGNTNIPNKKVVPGDDVVPNVDIWAVNIWRGPTLRTLFAEVKTNTTKPFWIAEMGIDSYDDVNAKEDQMSQAKYARALWEQVLAHQDIVFGADLGFYSDEWWKDTNRTPTNQDFGGGQFGNGPDNFINEEWLGVVKVSRTIGNIDAISPKEGYYEIQRLWIGSCPCSAPTRAAPFLSQYDATDFGTNAYNNYAGYCYANYGGTGGVASVRVDFPGASALPGDKALHATLTHPAGSYFTFFGVVETLFPQDRSDTSNIVALDLSQFNTISFDARIGKPTVTNRWTIRLEDTDWTGEHSNKAVELLPLLTTDFQSFTIPLQQFTNGPEQVVDLSRVVQIVFQVSVSNGYIPPTPLEIDLIVDNLRIFPTNSEAFITFPVSITARPLPGGVVERTVWWPAHSDGDDAVQYDDILGSSLFSAGDFSSLSNLVQRLQGQSDLVSEFLWTNFSGEAHEVLANPRSTIPQQQSTLAVELNTILRGHCIYETQRFAGVTLSNTTTNFLAQDPQGDSLMRLNRLLLEDTYPLDIVRSFDTVPFATNTLAGYPHERGCANDNAVTRGASLYSAGDFNNLSNLVQRLCSQSDLVSEFLWTNFSTKVQQCLAENCQMSPIWLIDELNKLIQRDDSIYDAQRFADVPLSAETLALKSQNPQGDSLIRLNRLLLEDAYPQEIAKCQTQQRFYRVVRSRRLR